MNEHELKLWHRAMRGRPRHKAAPAPARRSASSGTTTPAHRKAWRERKIEAGCCADCGKPRGDDGTTRLCRPCAQRRNRRSVKRTVELRDEGLCITCRKPRGEDGTRWYCREHAKAHNRVCNKTRDRKRAARRAMASAAADEQAP